MGGNALSPGLTHRKSLSEYEAIKSKVISILIASSRAIYSTSSSNPADIDSSTSIPSSSSTLITFTDLYDVPQKTSFGDLDLIFYRHPTTTPSELSSYLQSLFHPTEMIPSGNVLSLDFDDFQIDFIESPQESFELMKFCLSYGDRGMILGQIARWYGFALGYHGLMITREEIERLLIHLKGHDEVHGFSGCGSEINPIILSLDPLEIRQFMGLPLTDEMIQTKDDVGRFCKLSSWYRPEIFTMRLNAEGRKRWKKRPYYRFFVEEIIVETTRHYQLQQGSLQVLPPPPPVSSAPAAVSEPPSEPATPSVENHLFHHIDPSFSPLSLLSSPLYDHIEPPPLSLLPSSSPSPFPSPSLSPSLFTHTPLVESQRLRIETLSFALTYFHKWHEIHQIYEKYLQRREKREKFNYSHLQELGIPSKELIEARSEFIRWISLQKTQQGEEEAREGEDWVLIEEKLIENETKETLREKLQVWFEESWKMK